VITIENVRDWISVHLPGAADWSSSDLAARGQALWSHLAAAFAAARPYWREIVAVTGVAVAAWIVMSALHSQRRRRQLKASLLEATLSHDSKTNALKLGITMRNLQSRALRVDSIRVISPPGTKICEVWQAWQPGTNGVKFAAPDLQLTDTASIEVTLRPSRSDNTISPDELIRTFYVLPLRMPARQITLRARLICELQTRRGKRQELVFRRTLALDAPASPIGLRA